MAGLDFLMASLYNVLDGALAHVDRKHLFHQRSQSLVRYALHHAQVGHNGSDVLAKSYLVCPACAARILYCNIRRCRSSCNGDILSRQAPTLANLQLDLHSQALPLCGQVTTALATISTHAVFHNIRLFRHISVVCLMPRLPAGFKAALLSQRILCAESLRLSSFPWRGGVLLLFEFLSGFSYFSSRLRRLRFSFEAFPRYGANSHSPYVAHRWLHASTASQMSALLQGVVSPPRSFLYRIKKKKNT